MTYRKKIDKLFLSTMFMILVNERRMSMSFSTRDLVLVGLFAAIIAVCAQISLPLPFTTVPFSLQIFAVFLTGAILGKRLGVLALIVYLLVGAVGIPVFAGFTGGLDRITGATGGYLLSYPIAVYLIGSIYEKSEDFTFRFIGMLLGLIVIYNMGVAQLKYVAGYPWATAYIYGAAPFIVLDLAKALVAVIVSQTIIRSLKANNLLPYNLEQKQL